MRGGGAALGGVAIRDDRDQQAARGVARTICRIRARRTGGHSASRDSALRQSVRDFFSLLHGVSSASQRRRVASRVAFARAFLSTAASFGGGAEIHGGLRTAGDSAAGHYPGRSSGTFARCGREPVTARI